MPFDFGQIEPNRVGQVSQWDIPLNDWMGIRYGEGLFGRVGPRITDLINGTFDTSPLLSPKDANATFGIPGYLVFDSPVRMERARAMNERKRQEVEMMSYSASAAHSWFSIKAAAGFGAMAAGSLMHPVDALVNFLPFVGSEVKAASVLALGGNAVERALARGVITQEAIARAPLLRFFPNYSRSVIDATIGNAVLEIPNYILNVRDQAIYGIEDSAYNVMLGGFIGGTFGYGLSRSLHVAGGIYNRLRPETRDMMFKDATGAGLRGADANPARYASVDENALREQVKFDEVAAREAALRGQVGPEEARTRAELEALNRGDVSATDLLSMAQRAITEEGGSPRAGILSALVDRFKAGERGPEVFRNLAGLFDLRYNPLAPTIQEAYKLAGFFGPLQGAAGEGRAILKRAETELRATMAAIDAAQRQADLGGADAQVLKRNITRLERRRNELAGEIQQAGEMLKKATGDGPLTSAELQAHADYLDQRGELFRPHEVGLQAKALEMRVDQLREQRVNSLVDEARKQWEQSATGRLSEARTAELRKQQDAGKLLTEQQIETLSNTKTADAAAVIDEATKNAEETLKAMGLEVPASVKESVHKPRDKAIKQAVACLL